MPPIDWSPIVTNIVLALFGLLATAVTGSVVRFLHAHLSEKELDVLNRLASDAVWAAEQMHVSGQIDNKYHEAYGMVASALDHQGMQVSPTQIETAIESAVASNLNYNKLAALPNTVGLPASSGPVTETTGNDGQDETA